MGARPLVAGGDGAVRIGEMKARWIFLGFRPVAGLAGGLFNMVPLGAKQ
jgi:hypothetical protein